VASANDRFLDSNRNIPIPTPVTLMKKNSHSITARVLAGIPFFVIALFLLGSAIVNVSAGHHARRLNAFVAAAPQAAVPQPFSGTFDPNPYPCGTPRHVFTVPAGQARIAVNVDATVPANDLAVTLLFGAGANPTFIQTEDTGVGQEVLNYAPGGGVPAGVYQVQVCLSANPAASQSPYDYTGVFTYDNTSTGGGAPPPTSHSLSAAPQDNGPKIGYENFEPPGELTTVNVTSSGGHTVEYLGRNAIEPSIGFNWATSVAHYQCDLETLFIDFNNTCAAGVPGSTWVNRPATVSQFVDSDPILFTDRTTHRVFIAELTLLSPDTSKVAFSDDDGHTWIADPQSQGLASAVDHETMGGGPYHAPLPNPPPVIYPHAVYYCSQDIATAFCSRSDNGGLTFGGQFMLYNVSNCGGLHGHVKVGPDGTVYVPNRSCNGAQSVAVSKDNGVNWTVHPVATATQSAGPSTVGTGDDPQLAIDAGGRVYFAFSNFGTKLGVAVSDDQGTTWKAMYDVGAIYGLNNVCFPAAIAGDAGRAAVAFYGSTTPNDTTLNGKPTGNSNTANFTGVWHLYIAHTFNGGKTWTTSDATPLMPMQRSGLLRGGGADIVRNLADFFDVTIDNQGRVLVGYGNGCEGGPCAQAPLSANGTSAVRGNAYSATAVIARQSSGRRMLKANDPDPSKPVTVPGMPFVTAVRIGSNVRLMWNEADSGNSMINSYQIWRSTAPGQESLLTSVGGSQTGGTFDDTTATDPTKTYYYQVVAVNSLPGVSCRNNEVAAPYVGDSCSGIIIHRNDPSHPESTGGSDATQPPTPQLLIDFISVAEPLNQSGQLVFKMKVVNLSNPIPPNSRWRIAWDWFNPADGTQMYYAGMQTDAMGKVAFEYGTLGDAGVPAVLVLGETPIKTNLPQSPTGTHFDPDGTITIVVPKADVGNPKAGDLLGAIGGKTITGDTDQTKNLERSTAFVDHTFIKGQSDNAFPAATYTITGNTQCTPGGIAPVGVVSRKTHGNGVTFDIDLPLTGTPGVENRVGPTPGDHTVVITFAAPIRVQNVTVTPGANKAASMNGFSVSNTQITAHLTKVSNQQTLKVNLIGLSGGGNSGNVSIPMAVLAGDVDASRHVDAGDVGQIQKNNSQAPTLSSFRSDVDTSGHIDAGDVAVVQQNNSKGL
jgi:hypothetical protein